MSTHVLDATAVEKASEPVAASHDVLVHLPRLLTRIGVPATARVVTRPAVIRRRMSPESGRAIERLGHAIEYLTDEFVHSGCEGGFQDPRVEAIKTLMSLNRQVYSECPIVPTFSQRIAQFFHSA